MGRVTNPALPIALVSLVVGGYLVAADHLRDARVDRELGHLAEQLATLSEALGAPSEPTIEPSAMARLAGATARSADRPGDGVQQVRKQLESLRAEQAALRRSLDLLLERDADSHDDDLWAEEEAAELEASPEAPVASIELEDRFALDASDPDWAGPAELEIETSIEARAPDGVTLSYAECRGVVCKVEVDFDNARTRAEAGSFLPMSMPWPGESYVAYRPDDEGGGAVIYVAREGFLLSGEQSDPE